MKLNLDNSLIKPAELETKEYQKRILEIHEMLHSDDHSAGTTWVDWPLCYDKKEFAKILKLAKHIESNSDALLVIGIGGSYLGAKANQKLKLFLQAQALITMTLTKNLNI